MILKRRNKDQYVFKEIASHQGQLYLSYEYETKLVSFQMKDDAGRAYELHLTRREALDIAKWAIDQVNEDELK